MGVIRHRTGTTAENNARVGKPGLITQDTEAHALRVYDGATPGVLFREPKWSYLWARVPKRFRQATYRQASTGRFPRRTSLTAKRWPRK